MFDFSKIVYLIPIVDGLDDATLFQGYGRGLFPLLNYVYKALEMPASINDFCLPKNDCLSSSMKGINSHVIIVVNKDILHELCDDFHHFVCVFSTEETIKEVSSFINKREMDTLHVSNARSDNPQVVHIDRFKHEDVLKYCKKNLAVFGRAKENRMLQLWSRGMKKSKKWPSTQTGLKTYHHNICLPSVVALKKFKYNCKFFEEIFQLEDEYYVDAMLSIANKIVEIRKNKRVEEESQLPLSIDCILETPGKFELAPSEHTKYVGMGEEQKKDWIAYRIFLKHERKRNCYAYKVDGDEFKHQIQDNSLYLNLVRERKEELSCYTAAISKLCADYFAPSIRMNPKIKEVDYDLKRLAGCIGGKYKSTKEFKLGKIVRKISSVMNNAVGERVVHFIRGRKRIKIVGDYPLELMCVDSLPLMIRKNTSRIYPVPGNVFFQEAMLSHHRELDPYDLYDILVVRSFKRDDPIKRHLETGLQKMKFLNLKIKIVDVQSAQEFTDVLNKNKTNIMVMDCHGGYDKRKGVSYLKIGKENVNVFSLRGKCRVPPIVILSACETFPMTGRHANVANSFLNCGAVSVIGTFFPINSIRATVFVARLLYRIDCFVPLIVERFDVPMSWLDVVSGMFRMIYASDLACVMFKKRGISKEKRLLFQAKLNMLINERQSEWNCEIFEYIAEYFGTTAYAVKKELKENYFWSDVLSYVHIGRPELLIFPSGEFRAFEKNEFFTQRQHQLEEFFSLSGLSC